MSRFVVRELEGYAITDAQRPGQKSSGLSVWVADSARSWREVETWRTEDIGGHIPRGEKRRRIRVAAAELADRLNAEEAAGG